MENRPIYENTPEFEAFLDERIKSANEHPENLISAEEVLQRGWDKIAELHRKNFKNIQA